MARRRSQQGMPRAALFVDSSPVHITSTEHGIEVELIDDKPTSGSDVHRG